MQKIIIIILAMAIASTPGLASAKTIKSEKPTCAVTIEDVTCRVAAYIKKSETAKIALSVSNSDVRKVKVIIKKEGESKVLYQKSIKVKKGKWKTTLTKKLEKGTYDIEIGGESGKLVIGSPAQAKNLSASPFSVSPIPLLTGGTTRAGASVPVSYLKVINTGKEEATLKGFWITQNGSAPTQTVVGLSTVDDKGGSRAEKKGVEGTTLFNKNGEALAPTDAVFAPGQMKLFTIKAILASNISTSIGTQLMIDVVGLEGATALSGQFPVRGTTWTLGN